MRACLPAAILVWGLTICGGAEPGGLGGPGAGAQAALFQGQTVMRIEIEGVEKERAAALRIELPQAVGEKLDADKVAECLRKLYATGIFQAIEADAQAVDGGVALVFRGTARMFIGRLSVDGAKGATLSAQLERGSGLRTGTPFTDAKLEQAKTVMREVMAQNGYHEPTITSQLTPHTEDQLVDIAVHVNSGPQARVGQVEVTGDPGMSVEEFRRHAHLRAGAKVDRETVNRALAGVLDYYRSHQRLEPEIKLEAKSYDAQRENYRFNASQGPVVKVLLEGASPGEERIKRLIPIFEEGSVDDDLLNEGNRRLRDFYEGLGYFDVKVEHQTMSPGPGEVHIVYTVGLGARRHVESVEVDGNKYFDSATLKDLLSVHAASTLDRHGEYSQALLSADVAALEGVYRNNGFSKVKVTPETSSSRSAKAAAAGGPTTAPLAVVYRIEEGPQQHVGTVSFTGNEHVETGRLQGLINTEAGQLLSPRNLAGDRDTVLTDYLARGFDEAQVQVEQKATPGDAEKVDVVFRIAEGRQTFVRKVELSGLYYTRPQTVSRAITLRPGEPLSQAAMEETQRNLYEFALFNEIDLAVENPNGAETAKTVLVQATEARRWTFSYGGGFEVQTGTPVNGCQGLIAAGAKCTPGGKTGISPRLLLALTRNNLFGREQSASIQGTYGSLEQKLDLIYQYPRVLGNRNLGLTFTGGYANSHDVTTYVASRIEAGFRMAENFNHPGALLSRNNTFIYGYDFRRVKTAEDSLEVFPDFVGVLASAVRVGGPSFTWLRDTRDNPVDAHRGTYTTFQEFLSAAPFGAEAHFNRIDTSNSSYYRFGKGRFVLARNTRYGQERTFGTGSDELIPLPERLYAGGPTSLRGFSTNAAGPRDPDTGYPIGGAGALINNTELRLPPPSLPYFGTTVSFVLFHDMGNVFTNAGDVWESVARVRQPDRDACKVLTAPVGNPPVLPYPNGPTYSTGPTRTCNFNYFSHASGLGLRYHTPVGPIRLDFSYNLNPPIYPVNVNYSQKQPFENQHVGEGNHFNFFFSLGQTF
jgi:outer membrane protein assembly complex protein YaeT